MLRSPETTKGYRRLPMHSHLAVLLAMLLEGDPDGARKLPWECHKIEEFRGPGTDHVWQIRSASDSRYCIAYLESSVDGPALVEAVNNLPTLERIMA